MPNPNMRQRENVRYTVTGQLMTDTGLHIGSGFSTPRTDAAIVRDAWGRPYIPGSSFKGVLRSTVERLIGGLGGNPITSCQLADGYADCLSTNRARQQQYSRLQESQEPETTLLAFLRGQDGLCDTCWLFGSPFAQSRLYVKDLGQITQATQQGQGSSPQSEIRHGVGIDRETLTARDQIKFDYEVWPSQQAFAVELIIDRPAPLDRLLIALGVRELQQGFAPLGGIRSRGLGRCTLRLERVQRLDLGSKAALLAYLGAPSLTAAGQKAVIPGLDERKGAPAIDAEIGQWLAQLQEI
ncbi:MAG: hypothetical protein DYG89_41395 [Caldilinea sp. CFX5]|nr:hypothetical protein [Caldilinea sp. CFX5]